VKTLRIGSRGSQLALWQANHVGGELQRLHGVRWEIVIIKTSGDQFQQAPVGQMGQLAGLKGVFIKELEEALLAESVDLAVHSMKDVPTETPAGLTFPAVTARIDFRDALISRSGRSLDGLPEGAGVGTSSLRRQSQLLRYRRDLRVLELRGNVDTRLKKLERGDYDAIVLAKAGLDRLGLSGKITQILPPELSLPAVGQGALGIEARESDTLVAAMLAPLNHQDTRDAVAAERALLRELEGGCQVPLGAWGRVEGGDVVLDARVLSADGTECVEGQQRGARHQSEEVGRRLAHTLLTHGADRILKLAGWRAGA